MYFDRGTYNSLGNPVNLQRLTLSALSASPQSDALVAHSGVLTPRCDANSTLR